MRDIPGASYADAVGCSKSDSCNPRRICNGPEALRWHKIDARGVGEAWSNARREQYGRDQASVFEKSIGRGSDEHKF